MLLYQNYILSIKLCVKERLCSKASRICYFLILINRIKTSSSFKIYVGGIVFLFLEERPAREVKKYHVQVLRKLRHLAAAFLLSRWPGVYVSTRFTYVRIVRTTPDGALSQLYEWYLSYSIEQKQSRPCSDQSDLNLSNRCSLCYLVRIP
jgi:hypothetical protein